MATLYWLGTAKPISQVQTWAFGGTWEANDIIRVAYGLTGQTYDFTAGSTVTATVVSNLVTAWNNLSSSVYPELAEVTASPNGSTFTLTADTAGKPFAFSLTPLESNGASADAQTIEGGSVQTAGTTATANNGPNVFGVGANWSTGAIPAAGDTVVFANSSVDCLYLETSGEAYAAVYLDQSYTGKIGLPLYNTDGTQYPEYRLRYLLTDGGNVYVGRGAGEGSPRINLKTGDSTAANVYVYNTGTPESGRRYALQLHSDNLSNVLVVNKGSVGVAIEAGETSAFATVSVGYVENAFSDSTVYCGPGVDLSIAIVNLSGGQLTTESAIATVNQIGGELIHLNGTMTALNLDGGACRYRSTGTLTTANVGSDGNLDFRQDGRSRTVTNATLYERFELHDPSGTVTWTNGIDFVRCTPAQGVFDVVPNRTWTPTTI